MEDQTKARREDAEAQPRKEASEPETPTSEASEIYVFDGWGMVPLATSS